MKTYVAKLLGQNSGTVFAILLALFSFVGWVTNTGEKTKDNTAQIQDILRRMATKDDVQVLRQDNRELRDLVQKSLLQRAR